MPDMNIQTFTPAVKMTDHFTPIPPEVIQSIASYLYATHVPDKAYNTSRHPRLTSTPKSKPTSSTDDLIALALTSKPLFHHTNAWASSSTGTANPASSAAKKLSDPRF
jgi:hypothetical protein